ncbi:exosome complex component RRP45B [Citrus sinensis]|uniref:exosome complex component RRP45A-like isoform X3 n=1 Tax=Citrus sinensis TaxID=2711 RepID=UPI00219A17E1|nr:exosome complex component RRP45A-like isoform X3 [Citrus sinensis]KAH9727342.1 exosome complex component RRP45B [Citrus sinensis]
MDLRLANTWQLTMNEKKFIKTALTSGIRIDGRNPYEYRKLSIKFGREDGSSEVQLGQTHVMGFVTGQLAQPYRDRPNEGTLSIYTEFSPMADPSFEPGRPGESAVELGLIVDRGLRESRAVDTESLCVLAGKLVWAIRIDLHILDNGGNLVDAANIAALGALLTYRRPECSLGGEDGLEVIVHPPEEREPLPLIIHHLPIAVTFGFFSSESLIVIDPTHHEEAVMAGRMTATLNANGDVCAIQKPGGEGVLQSVIMQCLRLSSRMAGDMTKKIKDAVETFNTERALRKIKRHPTSIILDGSPYLKEKQNELSGQKGVSELSWNHLQKPRLASAERAGPSDDGAGESKSSELGRSSRRDGAATNFVGMAASRDPCSEGVDSDVLKASPASQGTLTSKEKQEDAVSERKSSESKSEEPPEIVIPASSAMDVSETKVHKGGDKTLMDAAKPKHKRKKRASSPAHVS